MAEPSLNSPRLLHEFFERSARQCPDHIAVDVPPGIDRPHRSVVTYRQMLGQADALAAQLHPLAEPDGVVAIILPRRSSDLYIAQLAVLRAGGAFTCIDPIFPDAHIQSVLEDGNVRLLLSDADGLARLSRAGIAVDKAINVSAALAESGPNAPISPNNSPARPNVTGEHLAYVIYTSGTTGVPKGVMIEHRSVANLVASDIAEFSLTPQDRVGQGSSAAYDSSIEETWLAFAAGATLVLMDDDTARMGPDLIGWLQRERISVFCPPPTLLRTTGCTDPRTALPDLRLLYVGGEALPDDLVTRWAPGRRLVNGYGPTECTVTVVRGDILPGQPVTIGKPVPGNTAYVVDSDLNLVPDGFEGELCIAGIGLARGYRRRDDVTREKFPVHPSLGRIYRTGELVRRESDGNLTYLGRIDAQVKLRGYRVELEAVEAHLVKCSGVREAACRVQGTGGDALLEAHLVASDPAAPPNFSALRRSLRAALPPYMVPTRIGLVDALPRSVGGKVDRKRLPDLAADVASDTDEHRPLVEPGNHLESIIAAAFASALSRRAPVSIDDDFFMDLGGDSLSAVGVICTLREHPETLAITTRDLYQSRTVRALATRAGDAIVEPPRRASLSSRGVSDAAKAHPNLVTAAQCAWLLVLLVAASSTGYAAVFHLLPLLLERFGLLGTLALEIPLAMLGLAAYTVLSVLFTAALKWTLIGRYKPIRTRVWSWYHLRHWIVQTAARAVPWGMLAETVAYGAVLRLLGAKVGRRVHVHRGVNLQQGGWDLLTIGNDVTLGREVHLGLVELDDGCLCVGPVTIHDEATLETRAAMGPDTVVERGGYLTALSWLADGDRVAEGEQWSGVPAARVGPAPAVPNTDRDSMLGPGAYSAAQLGLWTLLRAGGALPVLVMVYAISMILGLSASDVAAWLLAPTWTEPSWGLVLGAAVAWVPVWLGFKALSMRLVGKIKPGVIRRWSGESLRVWYKTSELEAAGRWLSGTLFWPIWLRLAGMKIGRGCEISTIIDVVPEHVRIGELSFFADGIYLGSPLIHRGTLTMGETSLGAGTFLGNHVIIPAGANLPADLFLGVCTVANTATTRPGTSWFGHPAMELPRREVVSVDRRLTYSPGLARYCSRVFWESLRFALGVFPLVVGSLWFWGMSLFETSAPMATLVVAPIVTLLALVFECSAVVALKWLLLGRARPGQHALWSCWCSRWDFLYVAWQFYASGPLAALEGTLALVVYLRAMGVRIGERVVLGPGMGQLADPDMVIIEDDATVSANYQAHSFEDRVLKLAPVVVRRGATVGESAVVFYGADIGERTTVTANSVVMKNERLSPGIAYSGCPVQAMDDDATTAPLIDESAVATSEARSIEGREGGRLGFLDIARGLAVMGMIYLHFVPAERTANTPASAWTVVAHFLEGKSAALFFVLAGAAWEIQARRGAQRGQSGWYFARRSAALAAAGIALHLLAWPTEVLVPLAVMMLLAVWLRSLGRGAVATFAALLLLLAPAVSGLFGEYVVSDWTDDGGHLADTTFGWVTARALVFDGNYPIVPWLAFALIGMLLVRKGADTQAKRVWLAVPTVIYAAAQGWVWWTESHPDAIATDLAQYVMSTWVPTSLPFALVIASAAVMTISALGLLLGRHPLGGVPTLMSRFGRASLTHYLAHICLVYVPLKHHFGNDEWSTQTGVLAFAAYVAVALPLSWVWFSRFKRGPVEWLWAIASGR